MIRIKDNNGIIHFRNPSNIEETLCGEVATTILEIQPELSLIEELDAPKNELLPISKDIVTCPLCAKVYCAVKNEPWNTIEDKAMNFGMYNAVKEDSYPMHKDTVCPGHSDLDGDECVGKDCGYWGRCGYSKEIIKDGDWDD